jgi:hypothetical protein
MQNYPSTIRFLTLMLPHQACSWRKEWIWGPSENFPGLNHLNAPISCKWGNTNSTIHKTLRNPKEDARLNATEGKDVIHFHKTNTIFPMLLVCNSGNIATIQWFKKWFQFVCLFRNASIVSSKNATICPDHLAPTTLVLLNSCALPLLWHQFV